MTVVGSAHVVIRGITDKLADDIQKGLNSAIPGMNTAGQNAGRSFSRGMTDNIRPDLSRAERDIDRSTTRAGNRAGSNINRGMNQGVSRGSNSFVRMFGNIGGRAGGRFMSGFNRGGGPSRIFIGMALRISALLPIFGALIGSIGAVVNGLFAMGAAAANAAYSVTALGGAFAAMIQGAIVGMVAFNGVGAAMSAGMKAAQASTADVAKDAGGMADAAEDAADRVRDAAENVADAEREAARAIRDALRGVRDAKQNLRDVYWQTARDQRDAIESVSDAEEAHRDAIEALDDAQRNLNDAYEEAKDRLLDLQFSQREGALAEQRAVMELQDALYMLHATEALPVDNRTRMEAVLAYQQAQLDLEEIQANNADTAQELASAHDNAAETISDAQEDVSDAQENVTDSARDYNDALEAQIRLQGENERAIRAAREALQLAKEALEDAYREAPRMIRDAKEALEDAKKAQLGVGAAAAAATPAVDAFAEAMEKLSPAAQSFVRYLLSIRGELQQLKFAAQEGLFPGLEKALRSLVEGPMFPALKTALFDTGQAIGSMAVSIANALNSGPFQTSFGRVTETNADILRQMGRIFGDLAVVIFKVLHAALPLTRTFMDWIESVTSGWRATLETKKGMQDLSETLNSAGRQMGQLKDIAANLWEGIKDLGHVATPAGQSLIDSFEKASESFAHFTDTKKKRQDLREMFADTADNLRAIGDLILVIGGSFTRMGANPAIADTMKRLEPVIKNIEKLMTGMLKRSGDDIIELINSIVVAFDEISQSGGFELFLKIMTTAVKGFIAAFKLPILGDILRLVVQIGAAMYAISIIRKFPGVAQLHKYVLSPMWDKFKQSLFATRIQLVLLEIKTKAAAAGTWLLDKAMKAMAATGRILRRVMSLMLGPWGLLIVGIVTGLILAYKHFDGFRKVVDTVFKAIGDAVGWLIGKFAEFWDYLFGHSIIPDMMEGFEAFGALISDVFNTIVDVIKDYVIPAFDWLVNKVLIPGFKIVGEIVSFVFNNILIPAFKLYVAYITEIVIPIITWLISNVIVPGFKLIGEIISFVFHNVILPVFRLYVAYITDVLIPIIQWLWGNVVKPAFEAIGNLIKNIWENWIKPAFHAWKIIIGVVIDIIKALWQDYVRPYFESIGQKIQDIWNNWIKPAFNAWKTGVTEVAQFIKSLWEDHIKPRFEDIGGKIKTVWETIIQPALSAFKSMIGDIKSGLETAATKIGEFWDGIKTAAKAPVRFVIETIYNEGLRKALNLIPGVDLGEAHVPEGFAEGGVLPGWTPGRDVHRFVSPTAGVLNLSGGEAVMRPEFTRSVGGEKGVRALNAAARRGVDIGRILSEQSHAAGGVVTIDGEPMSVVAAKQLALAEQMAGNMTVIQGSYQAASDYSGTSHTGGGVMDTGPGTFAAQDVLRRVGFAAWARNIPGAAYAGSGAHVHSVSLIDPAAAGNSQAAAYRAGGDGLGGPDYGPRPAILPNLSELLGGISVTGAGGTATNPGEDEKNSWTDLITKFPDAIKGAVDSIRKLDEKFGAWGGLMKDGMVEVGRDMVQWINDKIPDDIHVPGPFPDLPMDDNPISWPFDNGGIAEGKGWVAKNTVKPERMLSPRQTETFDKLVALLDKNGVQGANGDTINLDVHVPQDASAADVVSGIGYELHRLYRGGRYT